MAGGPAIQTAGKPFLLRWFLQIAHINMDLAEIKWPELISEAGSALCYV
jgi:hypothetical protein